MPAEQQPFRRVMADIRARIESGEWPPGHQLPKGHELAAMHEVSQSTVDRAIQLLRETGLLRGVQGKGVFVAERPGR